MDRKNDNDNSMLISVVVICYNAEEYLLQALESVKKQTYDNIELIFSDDCSSDRSFEIAENWIEKNKSRFNGVKLLKTKKNSGVTINCDQAFRAATGEWIKGIAGDDLLPPNSIANFLKFISRTKNDGIVCSKYVHFRERNGKKIIISEAPPPVAKWMFTKTAKEQYKAILRYNVMFSSYLISKALLEDIEYFDTSFTEIEDYPLALRITRTEHRIVYSNEFISYYHRVGHDSISGTSSGFLNESAFKLGGKLDREIDRFVLPNISKWDITYRLHLKLDRLRRYIVIELMHNQSTWKSRCVFKLLHAVDPIELKKKWINMTFKGR